MAGAPKGNQNAAKAKVWSEAIKRALDRRTARRADGILEIDALADTLLDECAQGEMIALKELGDRLEGKVAQGVIHSGDDEGGPVRVERIERVIVNADVTDQDS